MMEVVIFDKAPYYTLPGHDEIVARRLQGAEASSAAFAVVGHSSFPKGAVVPMDTGSIDKIYVVTDGELTVAESDGRTHVLSVGDSIFIPIGEARTIRNATDRPAAMIVVTPAPTSSGKRS